MTAISWVYETKFALFQQWNGNLAPFCQNCQLTHLQPVCSQLLSYPTFNIEILYNKVYTWLTYASFNKANSFEKKREKKNIADSYRSCVICNHRVEDPSSWNVLLLHQQQQRTKTQTQKLNWFFCQRLTFYHKNCIIMPPKQESFLVRH